MRCKKKVNLLISLIEDLKLKLGSFEQNIISQKLTQACSYLKLHNLTGLDIITNIIEEKVDSFDFANKEIRSAEEQILQLVCEIKQDFQKDVIPISPEEELFLNLSYNKFFDVFSEVYSKDFWGKESHYRFNKISQAFSIYSEILNHVPFDAVFKWLEKNRPPMEAEISNSLFKFIRHILVHFPFFDTWDEIWISKKLINWNRPNQSIDRFLKKYCGYSEVKYRFKENSKDEFTYITINFPEKYDNGKIYLKDIICEEEGVKFALIMMLRVLNTQNIWIFTLTFLGVRVC